MLSIVPWCAHRPLDWKSGVHGTRFSSWILEKVEQAVLALGV